MVLLALAVAYGVGALRIEFAFSSDPLGPRAFPLLLSAALALLALVWAIRPGEAEPWPRGGLLLQCLALVALAFLGAWLYERAGFLAATAIVCAGVALLFRATLGQAVLCGLGNAGLWWVVFVLGLEIPLPRGAWLGGP